MAAAEQTENPTLANTKQAQDNERLAQSIDHTKLTFQKEEDEAEAMEKLCREAKTWGFYAVCVRPRHVALAQTLLQESPVKIATVIGFPLQKVALRDELQVPTIGHIPLTEKLREVRQCVQAGADELDLVINVAQLKQDFKRGSQFTLEEFHAIHDAANGLPIKVILETDLLTPDEIRFATECCVKAAMAMVKTSTGMVTGGQGATLEAVQTISERIKQLNAPTEIKASGSIKTRSQALSFLDLGVQRLGTSSGVAIIEDRLASPFSENTGSFG